MDEACRPDSMQQSQGRVEPACGLWHITRSSVEWPNEIFKPKEGLSILIYSSGKVELGQAHPVVPGRPICGTRVPCDGRLRRAREGIEWPRAIGVWTIPREPKGRGTATSMRTSSSRHPKTWKPSPVSDFARHLYMLMNLGQRDEPELGGAPAPRITLLP